MVGKISAGDDDLCHGDASGIHARAIAGDHQLIGCLEQIDVEGIDGGRLPVTVDPGTSPRRSRRGSNDSVRSEALDELEEFLDELRLRPLDFLRFHTKTPSRDDIRLSAA